MAPVLPPRGSGVRSVMLLTLFCIIATGSWTFIRQLTQLHLRNSATANKLRRAAEAAAEAAYIVPGAVAPAHVVQTETVHVVVTACGNPSELEKEHYGLLTIKSMLMARASGANPRRPFHFHVVANVLADELLNSTKVNWDVSRYIKRNPNLQLTTYTIDDMDRAAAAAGVFNVTEVPHHVFKSCSASRLKLPFLLKDVPRALYIDWDSVTTCDVALFWDLWAEPSMGWAPETGAVGPGVGTALFGMALNDPTGVSTKDTYRENIETRPRNGGVGAGVMMWNFAALRNGDDGKMLGEYWGALQKLIHEKVPFGADYWVLTKAFPLGDQDMLNVLLSPSRHPEWLAMLPSRWNSCMELFVPLADSRKVGFEPTLPCITHFCGGWLVNDARYMAVPDSPSVEAGHALFNYIKQTIMLDDSRAPRAH